MKKIWLLLIVTFALTACKKEMSADEVTYEVTLVSSTTWHGSYLNENAQVVGITNVPSGWKYTFKNTNNLTVATLNAYPDGLSAGADCSMKIYVNGSVVVSGKSSISAQVQYIFP